MSERIHQWNRNCEPFCECGGGADQGRSIVFVPLHTKDVTLRLSSQSAATHISGRSRNMCKSMLTVAGLWTRRDRGVLPSLVEEPGGNIQNRNSWLRTKPHVVTLADLTERLASPSSYPVTL